MFDIGKIGSSFNSSPYYNGKLNGADAAIMQSQVYLEELLCHAETLAAMGYIPGSNVVISGTRFGNIDLNDLTPSDRRRLDRKVEEIIKKGDSYGRFN